MFACTLFLGTVAAENPEKIGIDHLRCEYRTDPLGIDATKPRLSWEMVSDQRGEAQSAYQVLVASKPELLAKDQGDLWDSGKVESDRQAQVEYAGKPLASRAACFWKVRIWDKNKKPFPWSSPESWSMGLLAPTDWQAKWIANDAAYHPAPEVAADNARFNVKGLKWMQMPGGKAAGETYLRKEFDLPANRKLKRAVLALYAFNECAAMVNGVNIGHAAHWEATARLDATKLLHPGANVVGLAVSHSDRYAPAAIGRLVLQFESGDDLQIPLDQTWKASQTASAGWDKPGFNESAWAAAEFHTGQPWDGPGAVADLARLPAPYFRKDFDVAQSVKRATVYVTAFGTYELRLNGKKVGKDVLAPGWTQFRKRVHYQSYDVSGMVAKGANTIGAILGDGWYASDLAHMGKRNNYGGNPRLLVQLEVVLADGSTKVVASDGTWKTAFGPILHADLLMGCEYDARLAMEGWDAPGFKDSAWVAATASSGAGDKGDSASGGEILEADLTRTIAAAVKDNRIMFEVNSKTIKDDPAPGKVKALYVTYQVGGKEATMTVKENEKLELSGPGLKILAAHYGYRQPAEKPFKIQASVADPSRVLEELPALKLSEPRPKTWVFDLGQNMVGWVRLKVHGPAGTRITVRHAEMLNADGTIYTASLRSCPATDFYILSGKGEEVFEPFFTFHGFRYVEVRGLNAKPGLDAVTGMVVHTPMRRTGSFECSYPLLNKLYSNIIWGQKGNYLEIPSDCPQRDERMGWTGDTQFFIPTGAYNFDVAAFFSRWLQTCEDDQQPDGRFPNVVPNIMRGGGGATAWGDAALICTYNIYRVYGDTRIVAERFAAMDRYMQWLATKTKDGISTVGGFGDWLNAGGAAKKEVMDTAYHAYLAGMMAEMAKAIGRADDAARYAKRHEEVKAAFVKEFLLPDGSIKASSQTGYALAFTMDLIPPAMREKTAAKFIDEIKRFDWHLATGFIGTPRLLPALSLAGRDDVANRLLLTDTYPSWLFPVKNGATTMWERWNGWTPDKGFGSIRMNSFNHYAFGAVGEYLYANIGGIRAASPGYKTITIRPFVGEGITSAKTSFDCIYGRIATDWKLEGRALHLDVTIPPNTTATVYVPTKDACSVTESDKPAAQAEGVKFLRHENGAAIYEVGSGTYRFVSSLSR